MQESRLSDVKEQSLMYGGPTLTNYKDKVIFMTGFSEGEVLFYDIEKNSWSNAPNLIEKRQNHSSCSLGERVYIFGGDGDLIDG